MGSEPPATSPASGLLNSVLTLGSGGGGRQSAVDAAQVYYHFKLNHAQVNVPAQLYHEQTVDIVEIDGRTAVCAATPGMFDSRISHFPQLKKSCSVDDSNPAVYGPCIKGTAPLLSSDITTLLTEKSQIPKRWAELFRSVLNCSSVISNAAIHRLPQVDTNNDLDLPPSLPETMWAVQQISNGKAPGSDAIPPEVYKHGGPRQMAGLTTLFQEMWRQE
ncbi:unnamed protein product [Schistocephalus solidus]|uniref:Mediator of RNA polymerase II transcription subunit 25 n=1 Tax=Schistocephalus solidus TaxID=70667 RepID=A0A183SM20_SCHSO|nr:unnamed protein product [Schistocephalus solidus]